MRINPAHAFPVFEPGLRLRGAGRFDDARNGRRSGRWRWASRPCRRAACSISWRSSEGNSGEAQQHVDWAHGKPREFDVTGAQAQVAAFRGRIGEARALYERTIGEAGGNQMAQVASGYVGQLALTEALYRLSGAGHRAGPGAIPMDTTYEPQLRAATALALSGSVGEADRWIARLRAIRPGGHAAARRLHAGRRGRGGARARSLPTPRWTRCVPRHRSNAARSRRCWPIYFRAEARRRSGSLRRGGRATTACSSTIAAPSHSRRPSRWPGSAWPARCRPRATSPAAAAPTRICSTSGRTRTPSSRCCARRSAEAAALPQ